MRFLVLFLALTLAACATARPTMRSVDYLNQKAAEADLYLE